MRILSAEDDVTSRDMLVAVLRKTGHEVTETMNGAEAWEELQKPNAPRLAILDWMMPEMDGLEVVRRVRAGESDHSPYLIMLTAKGEKADIITGLAAGANDYLVKPFDVGELACTCRGGAPPGGDAERPGRNGWGASPGAGRNQNPARYRTHLHRMQKNPG